MSALELKPGRFYKSKAGDVWCCYRVDKRKEVQAQAQARCVAPGGRLEYFYLDGRYDKEGVREHCLVEECGPNGEALPKLASLKSSAARGLNDLCAEALRIAVKHGFTDATPAEDIALMHSELSEALEDIRAGKKLNEMTYTVTRRRRLGAGALQVEEGVSAERLASMRLDERNSAGAYEIVSAKPCGVPSEMADVVIRVLHFCGKHRINLAQAVDEKMAYNETRPFKHGGKVV